MDYPKCWDCRYYRPDEEMYPNWEKDQREGCGRGLCCRHSPTAQKPDDNDNVVNYGYWPIVLSGDGCGEFETKETCGSATVQATQ